MQIHTPPNNRPRLTADLLRQRIRQGITLLDKTEKNWRGKIKLGTLNMFHAKYCVLGQVFGSLFEGLEKLGLVPPTDIHTASQIEENWPAVCMHGFGLGVSDSWDLHNYDSSTPTVGLTSLWREEIQKGATHGLQFFDPDSV